MLMVYSFIGKLIDAASRVFLGVDRDRQPQCGSEKSVLFDWEIGCVCLGLCVTVSKWTLSSDLILSHSFQIAVLSISAQIQTLSLN